MKKTLTVFIVFSLFIALAESVFVALNYRQQKQSLEKQLQQKIAQVRSSFEQQVQADRQQVSKLATYVAKLPAIQELFFRGRQAVEMEGGGAGGPLAAEARERLLNVSQSIRDLLGQGFGFLRMHYHLPGKSTSFLRVHKPEKYGDLLVPFRQLLVDAHGQKTLLSGLEIGRSDFSVRGVAPVFAYDPLVDEDVYVGTLEFATSLQQTIDNVAANQHVDIALLLEIVQLKHMLWPEQLERKVTRKGVVSGFVVEEASFPNALEFFEGEDVLHADVAGRVHRDQGKYHWLAFFPLRDYWGDKNPQRPAIGRVIISSDVTDACLALRQGLQRNILIAVLAFVGIEFLFWLALRMTSRKLERMVEAGRVQLAEKNRQLQEELVAREKLQQEREELIVELKAAVEDVKALSGLLPICSYCKKIRNDDGYWQRLEAYIESHSEAEFSHGICSECLEVHFPGVNERLKLKKSVEGGKEKSP